MGLCRWSCGLLALGSMTVLPCMPAPLPTRPVGVCRPPGHRPGFVCHPCHVSLRPCGRYNSRCCASQSVRTLSSVRYSCHVPKHPWCYSHAVGLPDSTARAETSGKTHFWATLAQVIHTFALALEINHRHLGLFCCSLHFRKAS